MAEVSTYSEIYNLGQAEIQGRGAQWTDFNEGSFLDSVNGGGATLADEVSRILVTLFSELFFGTATGDALDRLAFDRLNLTRNPASNALATLTWTRVAAGTYEIPLGTTFSATVSGEVFEFVSTASVTVLSSDTTVSVPAQAVLTGTDSNVPAGTITTIVDTVTADPTATVTNAQVAAGGADQETDEQFRSRIQQFFFSIRRATVGALRFAALGVPGVGSATVVEDLQNAPGVVTIYIGDPDAQGNDSLVSLVTAELENWRAAGVLVIVLPASAEDTAITFEVIVPTGVDTTQIAADIRASVEAFGDTVGAGQTVYFTELECAAFDANTLIRAARITSPSGSSISPTVEQNALRFPAGSITLTFTEI